MITTILSGLAFVVANRDMIELLGGSAAKMFTTGRNLISNDQTSTPEERAAALVKADELEAGIETRVDELNRVAPNS